MRKTLMFSLVSLLLALPSQAEPVASPRLGSPVSTAAVSAFETTVFPDGKGLPPGQGRASDGAQIYDERCSSCHGPEGRGETAEELVSQDEPLSAPDAAQTVGSYWPYAATLFDYIQRAMPMDKPGSLSASEAYAVSAYLLHLNGAIEPDAIMNADTLPKVRMRNRDGFDRIDMD